MGIEDLGGLGGLGGFSDASGMPGMSMDELQKQMVSMCQTTLEDLRKGQQAQQASIKERQQQLFARKRGLDKLSPEQVIKWKELEALIIKHPEFIEPLGLTLAGLVRSKTEVSSIIEEFPDMRFSMAKFLREEAARRRAAQQPAPTPAAAD